MNKRKIFGVGAVVLMLLVAFAPVVSAMQERSAKENDILITSNGDFDLKTTILNIYPTKSVEVENQEYMYVYYYIQYKISNVGNATYEDEGCTVVWLKDRGARVALTYWEIEHLKVEPGKSVTFDDEIKIRSEPDVFNEKNEELGYPLKDLIVEIDAGVGDINPSNNKDLEFSNILNYLKNYKPTASQINNFVPNEDKIERYIKINDDVEIPVFFEGYEGAIVKLKSVMDSDHAGYVGEAAILLLKIAGDIFAMTAATASFLTLISGPLTVIAAWLTKVVEFFTFLSNGIFNLELLTDIIRDLITKVIPAVEAILIEAAAYSATMLVLAENLKKDVDAFIKWQIGKPWEKPIRLFGDCANIKEGQKVKFYDYQGELLGESEPADSNGRAAFDLTREIKDNEGDALMHNCRIKAVYGDQTKYSKFIHSWAFSNGSFQWTFKFKTGGSRDKAILVKLPIFDRLRVLFNNRLLIRLFPNLALPC